jgi:formylglycine-generating enzyme required for sulfatase activity
VTAKEDPHAPLPVFVPLGGYTGPENAQAYVQGFFEEHGPYLPTYLRSKRVILLLDALNEMPQTGYKERVGRIQTLLDQHPDLSVVVTCRALDYVETLRLEKLEVKPLDPARQQEYLHRYLDPQEGEKLLWQMAGDEVAALWQVWQRAGGTWEQFLAADKMPDAVYRRTTGDQDSLWKRLQEGWLPALWALGRNPFMLVMLAQVYTARGGVLPQNRGRLFAAFVDTLLGREEKRCDPTLWPGADVLRLGMARLAFAMQEAGERGTAVDAAWAMKQMVQPGVEANRLAYLCASATLLDTSNGQVRFVHQLVQEYFAALALAGRLRKGDTLQRYWPKDWTQPSGWEETFILLAGMLPDMTALIERLLPVHPALTARCIAESGGERPGKDTVHGVQQRLVELVTDPRVPIPQRNAAGVAVNHVGDPRRGVGLRADGLPDIEWVLVPEQDPKSGRSEFIYGKSGERCTETDFWIARYPITYRQFQVFLNAADGFQKPRWWEGLAASQKHRSAPGEQRFKHWNHPREGASWYDAIAFCRWLTEKAKQHPDLLPADLDRSREWEITLPTEQQWEKAVRGHDGRQYPWGGDRYKSGYANIDETARFGGSKAGPHFLGKTSAVGMYPQGVSPYGVADLSGNVWEWCLNEYDNPGRVQVEGDEPRVLRGGSWDYGVNLAAAPVRHWDDPGGRLDDYGFRVCAVLPPP